MEQSLDEYTYPHTYPKSRQSARPSKRCHYAIILYGVTMQCSKNIGHPGATHNPRSKLTDKQFREFKPAMRVKKKIAILL